MSASQHAKLPAFVAECTLGRLAKWLRLAGFDTLYDSLAPDLLRLSHLANGRNRFVLSRTQNIIRHLMPDQGVLIRFDEPLDQVRQVIKHFDLRRSDLTPLSRCSNCNDLLQAAQRGELQGLVPDYILHRQERFLKCNTCLRVYWPGSHGSGIFALIDGWFAP